jgi:hypothetical protein
MKVNVGTRTQSGRVVEVELEDVDGEKTFSDWADISVDKRFKKLSAWADLLVLQYLLRDQEIHQDYFNERLKVLAKELK